MTLALFRVAAEPKMIHGKKDRFSTLAVGLSYYFLLECLYELSARKMFSSQRLLNFDRAWVCHSMCNKHFMASNQTEGPGESRGQFRSFAALF